METIPIQEQHTCGCGHEADALPELDARTIPHAVRHGAIIGALNQLNTGAAMVLVAPHDPKPLLAQIDEIFAGTVEVSYLETGPGAWKLQLARG